MALAAALVPNKSQLTKNSEALSWSVPELYDDISLLVSSQLLEGETAA